MVTPNILIGEIQKEFFNVLETKNPWSKNEIKSVYLSAVGRVCLKFLEKDFDGQDKENL